MQMPAVQEAIRECPLHEMIKVARTVQCDCTGFGLEGFECQRKNPRVVVPLPMGGDCGQCGRPVYACTCDFGV
jgi:hypothetical protein